MLMTQSTRDFYVPTFSVSPALRAQMLATLPACQVVEQEMRWVLTNQDGPWLRVARSDADLAPIPSAVSARTVLDFGDSDAEYTAAVVAGMTSVEALEELGALEDELSAVIAAAMLCNPVCMRADVPAGALTKGALGKVGGVSLRVTLGLAVVDAALRGESTYAGTTGDWSVGSAQFAHTLERQVGWSRAGAPNEELLMDVLSDEILDLWSGIASSGPGRATSGPRRTGPTSDRRGKWGAFKSLTRQVPARAGLGFGPDYDWAIKEELWTLNARSWREDIAQDASKTCGRYIGQRLFEVTGDDPGLWSVALELLEDWDRTLPEWLEAVEALQ